MLIHLIELEIPTIVPILTTLLGIQDDFVQVDFDSVATSLGYMTIHNKNGIKKDTISKFNEKPYIVYKLYISKF